jgi:hypothetical protein
MHVSWSRIIAALVDADDWGQNYESVEAAIKDWDDKPADVAAFGIIELLRRLEGLAPPREPERSKLVVPSNAKPYPDKEVGDFVWSGNFLEGFDKYVIVAKGENDVCLMIRCRWDLEYPALLTVACDYTHATLQEAVESEIKSDQEFVEKDLWRVKTAKKKLAAGLSEAELERFFDKPVNPPED